MGVGVKKVPLGRRQVNCVQVSTLNKRSQPQPSQFWGRRKPPQLSHRFLMRPRSIVKSQMFQGTNGGGSKIQLEWSKLPFHGIQRIPREKTPTLTHARYYFAFFFRMLHFTSEIFLSKHFPFPFVQLSNFVSRAIGQAETAGLVEAPNCEAVTRVAPDHSPNC